MNYVCAAPLLWEGWSALTKPLLCIHGHFYQPPRDDPFTGAYREEPSAAPYPNWNARITDECYAPNAQVGNFGRINFNLGGTLAQWMEVAAHDTYRRIVASVRLQQRHYGAGNAIAQAMHHTILPLARGRDKRCQIHWGIASYQHRFGQPPAGLWLPEMAVDYATLAVVHEAGLWFVVLSDEQIRGDLSHGAGPYKVRLSKERYIAVFVRDRDLSNYFSFNMPSHAQARVWMSDVMRGRAPGSLTLIATDGETFGHHHPQGVEVLEAITTPSHTDVYALTTLGKYLHQHPPVAELEIIENSAWSCAHHLGRWATGCDCTPGCAHWKGALRRALDNLAHDIDEIYVDVVRRRNLAPWRLRDEYIAVLLGQKDAATFLQERHLGDLSVIGQQQIIRLLQAQVYRQRMFVSCAFFFEDLERIEAHYAIASAVQAMALVRYVSGDDLSRALQRDLRVAVSQTTGRTGAQILDEYLAAAHFCETPLGGDMALSRPS